MKKTEQLKQFEKRNPSQYRILMSATKAIKFLDKAIKKLKAQ